MNNKKKISIIITIILICTTVIHFTNKIIFFFATIKEKLPSNNNNFYSWRFGKIYYTKRGNGNPLLLIHELNYMSSDYEWKEVINSLSENHTVYTIDLIGCGRSDKPKMTYTNYLYVQLITDFVKNVIKHKTSVIVTGNSSPAVIMTCYIEPQLFQNIILVNPEDISNTTKFPTYSNKLLKHLIETPIIGTLIYNTKANKFAIRNEFLENNFYASKKLKSRIIDAYYEAAHLNGFSAKYLLSSMSSRYTNININHALKEINNNIYILLGQHEINMTEIQESYLNMNSSIEVEVIPNTKHLPHIECPSEFLKICEIYL
ncbi:alpha/beta fold hydrolase [Anaeromicropila populeti]|uniref:Pimeloyl-ACP methyl ester carboxylesterase n=1 Tax=Anaeromicropila populeti TaxID=37658 RepID=A0A1I6LMM3_9FIRM|nr:alpha/beta fold hydrolase [Anaeromicropila populeti]SFS04691.1 Pimeloyl-ACP methyl ester carboxylesterase [Anaeromicropila populeti]